MGYSGARGTLIYEINLKAKILCQTPYNLYLGSLKEKGFGLVPNPLSCAGQFSYIHQLGTRVL